MDERLPVVGDIDYESVRDSVLALRERVGDLRDTAESDDGLIIATVDGYGRLLDLALSPRIYRTTDSRLLADQITETVRRAVELARKRVSTAFVSITAGQQAKPRIRP